MVGGALLVANNYKARSLVKKSQQEVMDKVDSVLDEKLKAMDDNASEGEKMRNNMHSLEGDDED